MPTEAVKGIGVRGGRHEGEAYRGGRANEARRHEGAESDGGTKGLRDQGIKGRSGEREGKDSLCRSDEGTEGPRDHGTEGRGDGGIGGGLSSVHTGNQSRAVLGPEGGDVTETVAQLRGMLERYRGRAFGADQPRVLPTGLVPLNAVLPHGGLPAGAVTEVLFKEAGSGAMSLVMGIVGRHGGTEARRHEEETSKRRNAETLKRRNAETLTRRNAETLKWEVGASGKGESAIRNPQSAIDRRMVVMVDTVGDFYPPAAWAMGVDPDRLLILRPKTIKDTWWAVDLCLRCSAVGVVVATLPRLETAMSRRLQLAAESGGTVGLILRPAQRCEKTFAAIRMLVEPIPAPAADCGLQIADSPFPEAPTSHFSVSAFRRFSVATFRRFGVSPSCLPPTHRITLIKVREGMSAEPVFVNLMGEAGYEAGPMPVHAVSADRAAGAKDRRVSA